MLALRRCGVDSRLNHGLPASCGTSLLICPLPWVSVGVGSTSCLAGVWRGTRMLWWWGLYDLVHWGNAGRAACCPCVRSGSTSSSESRTLHHSTVVWLEHWAGTQDMGLTKTQHILYMKKKDRCSRQSKQAPAHPPQPPTGLGPWNELNARSNRTTSDRSNPICNSGQFQRLQGKVREKPP